MNLFFKIFLWFLAAIALMIAVVIFLTWSIQTEPVVSRWQISVRNQMNIYADTAEQVYKSGGEEGLREFIERVKTSTNITEADIVGLDGEVRFADVSSVADYGDLVKSSFESKVVQFDTSVPATLAAKDLTLDGKPFVLILRWERPQTPSVLGDSWLQYWRFVALLLTALILCYALAVYLSSPIGKIRRATLKLAEGDLETRVGDQLGSRRDELSALAKDFDVMAERIESLVTSQQRLTRDVSHELRSPLARMNVALEIAKKKATADTTPMLDRIETESFRLNEMISRLLTLAKLESGIKDFRRENVNLRNVIESVVEDADFEAKAKDKSVVVKSICACDVFGNERLLRSAFENVVRNAVRYTSAGTAVTVNLEVIDKIANISVKDHGGGVPENELKKLFRPFYRVGESRERTTGGSGLGLAIAEQAIKIHDGKITAENRDDGLLVQISLGVI